LKKLYILLLLIIIAGCTAYRELFKTSAINSKPTENGYVYENDTLKITYHFWKEDGVMWMKIYNKLNVPIFIDWKVSSFVENDNTYPYWYNEEQTTSAGVAKTKYGIQPLTGIQASKTSIATSSNTIHPDRIMSITPLSAISKESYSLIPLNQGYEVAAGEYTIVNSPIKFRNYLYFSMNEAFTKQFTIDNQFYVSHSEFIKDNKFIKWKGDNKNGSAIMEYPYKDMTSFYSERVGKK
jgi:hypothetical protein